MTTLEMILISQLKPEYNTYGKSRYNNRIDLEEILNWEVIDFNEKTLCNTNVAAFFEYVDLNTKLNELFSTYKKGNFDLNKIYLDSHNTSESVPSTNELLYCDIKPLY